MQLDDVVTAGVHRELTPYACALVSRRPAGSERQKASGAQGERLKEATAINKSLSALGNVIMSLVDQQHVSWLGESAAHGSMQGQMPATCVAAAGARGCLWPTMQEH